MHPKSCGIMEDSCDGMAGTKEDVMGTTAGRANSFGELISIGSIEPLNNGGAPEQKVRRDAYVWRPAAAVIPFLPRNFEIPFMCMESEGVRRFGPPDSARFCHQAAIAGQAILDSRGVLSQELRATHCMMRLLFQQGPRLRERLRRRTYSSESDLIVRNEFVVGTRSDVLPDDLGGVGPQRWSVKRLLEEGRRDAQKHGICSPTFRECIIWGVDFEAQLHPTNLNEVPPERIRALLRQILFDLGPTVVKIDATKKDQVYGRLVDAMQSHLNDSDDDFNHWFFENSDGVIHQIAKKKRPDGPIERQVVRQTVLEIVADSWSYVGGAISEFTKSISMAIDPPLTPDERSAFDVVYRRNPHLGGLPLILLHEQFPELQHAVLAIMENPHAAESWGRFVRALQTHATMSARRREADKLIKHTTKSVKQLNEWQCEDDDCPKSLVTSDGLAALESQPESDCASDFDEIATALLKRQGKQCKCTEGPDWAAKLKKGQKSNSEIKLTAECRRCARKASLSVPREQFVQVARDVVSLKD